MADESDLDEVTDEAATTSQFLDTTGDRAGDIVLADGINWSALAKSMVGSVLATYFLALNAGIEMLTSAYGLVLSSVSDWIETAIETAVSEPLGLLEEARLESLAAIDGVAPVLAFPIGVGLVLSGLFIVSRGVEVVR